MIEVWRKAPGFEGIYQVSNQGRVRRCIKGKRTKVGRLLSPRINTNGYWQAVLFVAGKRHARLVNRLVCEAFHGESPTPAHQAAHGNGNHRDNRASNLRWATQLQNSADAVRHGTLGSARGEKSGMAKLTEDQVRKIRAAHASKVPLKEIAAAFGITAKYVSQLAARVTWKHVKEFSS